MPRGGSRRWHNSCHVKTNGWNAKMITPMLDRRRLLASLAAVGAVQSLLVSKAIAAPKLTVGVIYVGPKDDYGYNQAQAEGAAALKAMSGVKVLEEERVPETDAVAKAMSSMIELDEASLLFPTSFGYYSPYMIASAKAYPSAQFRHCGGMWTDKDPKNAGSYFGYIDEAQYLAGIVAAHTTKTKKFGFVAAKPIPQVLRNINSFTLGAKIVDPSITTKVIFTGDWSLPVREAEATNSLCDQGIDVITCHVDSPKVVIQTAEGRGIYTCGYHVDQSKLAPKGFLTGAEWNWAKYYGDCAKDVMAGKAPPNFTRGGLKEGLVKCSPYGQAVSEAARKQADDVKAKILSGGYVIYKGPIVDNAGNTVIASGDAHGQTDLWLEKINWLVDGVVGTV